MQTLRRSLRGLEREGLRYVHRLRSVEDVDGGTIERTKLWIDKRGETGPFGIIGDVHGCADELEDLLGGLGYGVAWSGKDVTVTPPLGRRAVFLGDFVDREPRSTDARADDAARYRAAYNRYVRPAAGIDDVRVAPFHLLASEGAVHADKDHLWHMAQAHGSPPPIRRWCSPPRTVVSS